MIEKIKAEIERRVDILTHIYAEMVERKDDEMRTYYHGKIVAIEELLSFIESMEKEQPQEISCEVEVLKDSGISFLKEPFEQAVKSFNGGKVIVQIRKAD